MHPYAMNWRRRIGYRATVGPLSSSKEDESMADAIRIQEHMPVVCSSGQQFGTVDHPDAGDTIKLTKETGGSTTGSRWAGSRAWTTESMLTAPVSRRCRSG